MIELYRSCNDPAGEGAWAYTELCRNCAAEEIKLGHYVEYDGYLSYYTNAIDIHSDFCQKCGESFFVDGRRKFIHLDGVVY